MSTIYRVLYRKWRPKVFSDVIGQPQVTTTLSSQIKENRLSHAYLFTGSRGTGKTTCAKIFSKAVNCLHPVNGDPCNECEICKGIDAGSVLDIVEIDAASNRSIDDIRLLKDEANFTPSQARFRVYIIDEVHMLTIEAFNALLKTLEEPPEHVKFILATTEVHKLPATILSRCQRFDFRRIEPQYIAERLQYIAGEEGAVLSHEAAMLIARIADGGMRDALSLLDRCISVSNNVDVDTVSSSAGLMGREHVYSLIKSIAAGDTAKCLMILDELHKGSCDTERLCTELIDRFRSFLIVKTVDKPENLLVCTTEELKEIVSIADLFSKDSVLYALDILTSASDAMRRTQNRRIEAEMALIRLCRPETDDSSAALLVRISALEKEIENLKKSGVRVPLIEMRDEEAALKRAGLYPVKISEDTVKLPVINMTEDPKPAENTQTVNDSPNSEARIPNSDDVSENKSSSSQFKGFGSEGTSSFASQFVADDSGDDEEFDFDAFMKEHEGAHKKQQSEDAPSFDEVPPYDEAPPFDEVPPFDDAPPFNEMPPFDDAPPFGNVQTMSVEERARAVNAASSVSSEEGQKIDNHTWGKIVLETEKLFKPLIGQLTGSRARISGNTIFITLGEKNLKLFVSEQMLGRYCGEAANFVLGKQYNIKLD